MGWETFIQKAGLSKIGKAEPDPGNPGQHLQLYDVPEALWGWPVRVLLCTNGSPERTGERRRYALTVPASMTDPIAAAGWTYRLTRDQYAATLRRT
jgi:hypothetical protein